MANNKNQVHLYLLDSTKEKLDEATAKANALSKKSINRNELTKGVLINAWNNY